MRKTDGRNLLAILLIGSASLVLSASSAADFNSALRYMQLRHYDKALLLLDSELLANANNSRLLLAKAETLAMMEKRDASFAILNDVLKTEPHNADALTLRSRVKFLAGMYASSKQDALAAIKLQPRKAAAYVMRAELSRVRLEFKEAILDCTKARSLEPENADVWRQTAVICRNRQSGPRIVEAFQRAIALAPDDTRNYDELASFYIERRKFDNALPLCKKALAIDRDDGFALLNRAQLWLARKNYRLALADADRAMLLMPWSGWPNYWKAETYISMLEDDHAIDEYSRAIEKQSMVSQFYLRRGMSYIGKRDYDASIRDLTRSYECGHGDIYPLAIRADAYQAIDKWELSLADLTTLIKCQPRESNHYVRRGAVLKHLKRAREAEQDFTRAIELRPTVGNYSKRGAFYNYTKAYAKAISDFTAALKIDSRAKQAQQGLATAYEGIGMKDLAAKARVAASDEIEGLIDSYSRASEGFMRLKHSLGK